MANNDEHTVEFEVQGAVGDDFINEAAETSSASDATYDVVEDIAEEVELQQTTDTEEIGDAQTDEVAEEEKIDLRTKLKGVLGNKTLEDVIEREAREEDDSSSPFSLSRTLGGVIISRFIQKQFGVVSVICAFLIIYITLRYMCQQRLVEIDRVESKIVEARYKATVCSSRLTEASRESNVLKRLSEYGDSTLTIPNEPPYLIKIEK